MTSIILKTWALFFGFAIISLAHGLQGTLLGVRAIVEGFSFISTGFVVAGYYVGYLTGSILIPIFLQRVGHIRVFAALASLASIAFLLQFIALAIKRAVVVFPTPRIPVNKYAFGNLFNLIELVIVSIIIS